MSTTELLHLALALGLGLLIGAERERRKTEDPGSTPAGVRTFSITALGGALAMLAGGPVLLAVATVAVALLAAIAYWRAGQDDHGLTSEIALVLTVLLGGLAMTQPAAAAAAGVVIAILLAARTPIHHFVNRVLTEEEIRAGLVLAAATLVIMPLLPDQAMGPYGALNPQKIWRLVVLVLAIGALGHVAVRALGARFGLPVAGLASGFVSSSATIGAMGAKSRETPEIRGAATAGAVLSTVATVIQMAVIVGVTSPSTLQALALPLAGAGVAAVAYGAVFTLLALRQPGEGADEAGKAFSLKVALVFAATLSVVLLAAAALREWFGEAGVLAAAGVAGFADTHAAAERPSTPAHGGRRDGPGRTGTTGVGVHVNTSWSC